MIVSHSADRREAAQATRDRDWPNVVRRALNPLWVGGVALLCLLSGYLLTPALSVISPRAGVWAQYLALGTLFPALLAAIVWRYRSGRRLSGHITTALAILPIVAITLLAGPVHAVIAIGLATGQTAVSFAVASRQRRLTVTESASLFAIAFIGWAVVLEVLTWEAMAAVMSPSLPVVLTVVAAVVACSGWLFGARLVGARRWPRLDTALATGSVLVLVLLASRTDGLFTSDRLGPSGTFYHWGALVAPAEAARQGGWVLWDTPAPYGFLLTLTLAAFPAATAWQALYLLNAVASAMLAIWLFFSLRAVNPGIVGTVIAAAASAAAVFFLPARPEHLMPEHYMPMAGAFRYGWVYVLLGILWYERSQMAGSPRQRALLGIGTVCWLLSVFWSVEVAFVCSAIWLPAFVLIVLRDHGMLRTSLAWRGAVAWLALPLLLVVAALAATFSVYRVRLGHGPDLFAYVETVLTFSGSEFGAKTGMFEGLGPNRTIVVLLFAFLLLAMAGVSIALSGRYPRSLPVLLGASLGLWGLASYPLGLATPYTFFRLLPFALLALALAIVESTSFWEGEPRPTWATMLRGGMIPLVAAILVAVIANLPALNYYAEAVRREGFHGGDVTAVLPRVDPELARLMQEAGVAGTDPILYAGARFGDMMPRWTPAGADEPVVVSRQWLAGPFSVMATRPDTRKQTFMQRRADRQQGGGWLIERQEPDGLIFSTGPWFFAQVSQSFVPTRIAENANWRIVWYEPKDAWQTTSGAGAPPVGPPHLPTDLSINGAPLAGEVLPSVWGYFGPEWTMGLGRNTWRCTPDRGTISLFVPSSLRAELDFKTSRVAVPMSIAVNDGPAEIAEPGRGGRVVVPLSLAAGWNVIAIAVEDDSQIVKNEAMTAVTCGAGDPGEWPLMIHSVDLRLDEAQVAESSPAIGGSPTVASGQRPPRNGEDG